MKNVTVTLPEDVAHWARRKAAEEKVSVSRLIAGMLEDDMRRADRPEENWRAWTQVRTRLKVDAANRLSRAEAHERR